ncbi:MAG: DnaJ domain-containing protein [Deltaproteobacteria bacterium]|nr:DnaJ domain-containing protein [Deltaproteobacteria bacterium]
MDLEFLMAVEARSAAIDAQDYFEVLGLPREAQPADIKAAYYRESRAFHPDRFAAAPSAELRAQIGRIYRRINEAYTVLRDDARRRRYLADVTGPERDKKLRFTEAEESQVKAEQKQKLEEVFGQTPNGRKFYAAALKEVEGQRWDTAERAIKSALMYEPGNARFKELLAQIEKSKPKHDPFKIR